MPVALPVQPEPPQRCPNPLDQSWHQSHITHVAVEFTTFLYSRLLCAYHQVVYNSFNTRSSLQSAFVFETEVRFKDVNESERLVLLPRGFVMHWLFFLVGTHASILKLVGAHGLPWTKAIGLCYAASFVFWKTVIWLYPKNRKKTLSRSMLVVFATRGVILVHHYLWPFLELHFPSVAERPLIIESCTARLIEARTFRRPVKTKPEWMVRWQVEDRDWLLGSALTMFLANVTLFVLWYCYRYEEAETGYPSWTEGMS